MTRCILVVDDLRTSILRVLTGDDVMTERDRLRFLTALWDQRGRQLELMRAFRRLTPREQDVLHELCEGRGVHTIAATSYVSIPTVRTQVRAVLSKLAVTSQLEAVALAYRSGWQVMRQADQAG